MIEQKNTLEAKELLELTHLMEMMCFQYSKTFNPILIGLYKDYALEDINSGRYSFELFLKGFKQAGKTNTFFPTYSSIVTEINNIKERSKYINPVSENLLTEGEIPDSEEVKQKIKDLRNMMKI